MNPIGPTNVSLVTVYFRIPTSGPSGSVYIRKFQRDKAGVSLSLEPGKYQKESRWTGKNIQSKFLNLTFESSQVLTLEYPGAVTPSGLLMRNLKIQCLGELSIIYCSFQQIKST